MPLHEVQHLYSVFYLCHNIHWSANYVMLWFVSGTLALISSEWFYHQISCVLNFRISWMCEIYEFFSHFVFLFLFCLRVCSSLSNSNVAIFFPIKIDLSIALKKAKNRRYKFNRFFLANFFLKTFQDQRFDFLFVLIHFRTVSIDQVQ